MYRLQPVRSAILSQWILAELSKPRCTVAPPLVTVVVAPPDSAAVMIWFEKSMRKNVNSPDTDRLPAKRTPAS